MAFLMPFERPLKLHNSFIDYIFLVLNRKVYFRIKHLNIGASLSFYYSINTISAFLTLSF